MAVLTSKFSERVFEFSFNAEYAERNKAVLAGVPHIPTQNEEKWLGYDVALEIKQRGGAVHALALQHKVCRHVNKLGPGNRRFWKSVGGPYFAFRLDSDQYNLIQTIASVGLTGVDFFFCAPRFVGYMAMNTHYLAKTVEPHSVWIDVAAAGQIVDDELHTIVYSEDGSRAFRFSEKPVPLNVITVEQRHARRQERQHGNLENVEMIYETAFNLVENYWSKRRQRRRASEGDSEFRLPARMPERKAATLENTAQFLSQYFGSSVLIEVRK